MQLNTATRRQDLKICTLVTSPQLVIIPLTFKEIHSGRHKSIFMPGNVQFYYIRGLNKKSNSCEIGKCFQSVQQDVLGIERD